MGGTRHKLAYYYGALLLGRTTIEFLGTRVSYGLTSPAELLNFLYIHVMIREVSCWCSCPKSHSVGWRLPFHLCLVKLSYSEFMWKAASPVKNLFVYSMPVNVSLFLCLFLALYLLFRCFLVSSLFLCLCFLFLFLVSCFLFLCLSSGLFVSSFVSLRVCFATLVPRHGASEHNSLQMHMKPHSESCCVLQARVEFRKSLERTWWDIGMTQSIRRKGGRDNSHQTKHLAATAMTNPSP